MSEYQIFEELEINVVDWATRKGILDDHSQERKVAQLEKFNEEANEFMDEVHDENLDGVRDELGDVLVTLTIQANLWGLRLTECLAEAYEKINARSGRMVEGVFVKDS